MINATHIMTKSDIKNEDEVSSYISRLIKHNEKLKYWYSYLDEKYNARQHLEYMGISIWDVLIGSWAPYDFFNYDEVPAPKIKQGRLSFKRINKGMILIARSLNPFVRNMSLDSGVLFVAFERRQISTFLDAINILDKKSINYNILTTSIPSYESPPDFKSSKNVLFLEDYISLIACADIIPVYLHISKWLGQINVKSEIPEEQAKELANIVRLLQSRLFDVLLLINSSHKMIKTINPGVIVAADNSDRRARALFLAAKKHCIPTHHSTYGFLGFDCFEEKYLVADKKHVFSQQQKQILIEHFGLNENNLYVLGCPRFDNLFRLRREKVEKTKNNFTVLLGSQPYSTGVYGCITKELKMNKIKGLFKLIGDCPTKTRVIIKPHPDETIDEINEIQNIALETGIDFELINQIDFRGLLNEVDLFVTFYSTLALEFMILGIPVCFLISVENIPILKESCNAGVAFQALNERELETYLSNFIKETENFDVKSAEFLRSEFTKIDGTVSEDLVNILIKDIKV